MNQRKVRFVKEHRSCQAACRYESSM